jgi:SAM-dependent methyltransferase
MRRDVLELREFYSTRLGLAAREMVARKVWEAWGDASGLDVLGLGYATPYLEMWRPTARRTLAAMPAQQGVEVWPHSGRIGACLIEETASPFANALFDRVMVIHALEESVDPEALLREVWRVLAPSGRVVIAAACRRGLWSGAESTPFGHGRAYTRRQLEALVREAELEPTAWSRAVYLPPVNLFAPWADVWEQVGSRLWPPFAGVILLEAVKQTFAVKPKALRARARVFAPALQPAGVGAPARGITREAAPARTGTPGSASPSRP